MVIKQIFNPINTKRQTTVSGPPTQHKNLPCANPLNLEIFIFFFANTSSVWINSTVKATDDIFSLDKHHYRSRTSRPRSTFSLDKQHCVEADWLSIQVSVEKDFRILIGKGHLISLLGEVRCYRLLHSAH